MKKCYLISIDFKPERSYAAFKNAIKDYGTWARITESTFAVVTTSNAKEIRNNLTQFLRSDDKMIVIKTGGSAAWRNAIANSEWLKKYLTVI